MIRHAKQWAVVGGLCVAAFLIPFRFETDALFYIQLMNAAHLPAFFALTLFAHAYWPWKVAACRRRLYAAGGMAALSAAIEIIQPLTGRSESITDFLNGATGILIAMVLLAARESPRRTLYLCLLVPLAAACTAVAFLPAWKESAGMRWRSANFPMLGDFENEDELRLWIGSGDGTIVERVPEHASHGLWSLRVTTKAGAVWPGVRLLNAKQDWRGRTALAFDIWNDGPAFTLAIRVDDDFRHQAREDRYNSDLAIGPGWNHIAIPVAEIGSRPKNRRLNLAAIQTTVFYVNEPKTTHAFYIDHMRLE